MRNGLAFLILISTLYNIPLQASPMDKLYLSTTLTCKSNSPCSFTGEDIIVNINIKNISENSIGFPAEFLQRRGPFVTITDRSTKKTFPKRTNLAPHDLINKFTVLKSGDSLDFDTTIRKSEILSFRIDVVDLVLTISPSVTIKLINESEFIPYDGESEIGITSLEVQP